MLSRTKLSELRHAPLRTAPNKVALAMDLAGVTQVQIEHATGIPQSYVSRIKRGRYSRRGLPGGTMSKLAAFFGCQSEDLFPARESVAS